MKTLKKKFSLSYPDLAMFVSDLVITMTRDAVQFATRGVTAGMITALETLGNDFEVFPTDEYYIGAIQIEVDAKNSSRETATLKIQYISGFFEQKYGIESGEYKQLRVANLVNLSDNNFLVTARAVVSVATSYLSQLTAIGLTQNDIDALEDEAQIFEDKLNAIALKRKERDNKATERADLANELYDFVSQYCKIGKLIWENVNEAKYNDYIIYKTVQSGLSKPQNLVANYDPMTPGVINLTWDEVADATIYEIFVSIREIGQPAGDFSFLNSFPINSAAIPPVNNKRNYFKIKAKNDTQTSSYSDEAFADVIV
jgi:hypothetical protein